jgi:hypothetical protein
VILVHRLLKNHIAETMGLHAYIFFTDAALGRLDLDRAALDLTPHSEEYEHLGVVSGAVENLAARWRAEQEVRRVRVDASTAPVRHDVDQRTRWEVGLQGAAAATSARLAAGAEVACDHGHGDDVETILDWRPFEYFTVRTALAAPLRPAALTTIALEPRAGGTRVSWSSAPMPGWRNGLGFWLGRAGLAASQRQGGEQLQRLLAVDWQPPTDEPLDVAADASAAAAEALASPAV